MRDGRPKQPGYTQSFPGKKETGAALHNHIIIYRRLRKEASPCLVMRPAFGGSGKGHVNQ